jgi:hypothetical protein
VERSTIALTLEGFLSKENTNTKNVLYNIAVVNARLSNAIAKALNLQKNIVESISEELNRISSLNVEINSYKPNSVANPPRTGPFGKTAAEALRLLEAMKTLNVEGLDTLIALARGTPSTPGAIPQVLDTQIQLWAQKLNAESERLSSKSQQETLRIQTFTSRYTQATDQATNVVQKDGQSKSTIIQNVRS